MYKFSKIGVLVLYPILNILLPLFAIGTILFRVSDGGSLAGGLGLVVIISTFASFLLLLCVAIYLFFVFQRKLFAKQEDGRRKANIADYFATIFAIFTILGILSNLLKLFT